MSSVVSLHRPIWNHPHRSIGGGLNSCRLSDRAGIVEWHGFEDLAPCVPSATTAFATCVLVAEAIVCAVAVNREVATSAAEKLFGGIAVAAVAVLIDDCLLRKNDPHPATKTLVLVQHRLTGFVSVDVATFAHNPLHLVVIEASRSAVL